MALKNELENSGIAAVRAIRNGIGAFCSVWQKFIAEDKAVYPVILGLLRSVLDSSGATLSDTEKEAVREFLAAEFSPHEISRLLDDLPKAEAMPAEECAAGLSHIPAEDFGKLLRALVDFSLSLGNFEKKRAFLRGFAFLGGGISETEFDNMVTELQTARERRGRIIRSGAGVLAALIVIAVFILTATLLKSVIFGLIGAYLLLPVEKYFERKIRSGKGLIAWPVRFFSALFSPLSKLSKLLSRKAYDAEKENKRKQQMVIVKAVACTCVLLLVLLTGAGVGISAMAGHYVHDIRESVQMSAEQPPENIADPASSSPAEKEPDNIYWQKVKKFLAPIRERWERLWPQISRNAFVQKALEKVSRALSSPDAQQKLTEMLLRRAGGLFSFTTSLLGRIGGLLADVLLTVFFFLLFLIKLAEYCKSGDGADRQEEYLVLTVFNGNWLPKANPETIAEARRIIGGVIARLRTWVRGYITLILIDGTFYTTVFYFLNVPYFWALGPVAGCGILLPYIGPFCSAGLTLTVTLAVTLMAGTPVDGTQLCEIAVAYLFYNGIIEQFILYPMVIGDSLGLTALETIIVVLLGAIFAGLPGMILAIPAASIFKYLVPQIYRCFEDRGKTREIG